MAQKYPVPGVYSEIIDKSQYAVSLGGNQAALLFTSNQGPYAKWTNIYNRKTFLNLFGNPVHTSAYGAYIVADLIPTLVSRVGWVYPGSTNAVAMDTYFQRQRFDTITGTVSSINVLQARTGAFTMMKREIGTATPPELINASGFDLIATGAWQASIDVAAAADFTPASEDLAYDPTHWQWYAEFKHPERPTVHTIYGKLNAESNEIEFYNPLGKGKVTVDMTLAGVGTIAATDWASGTSGDVNMTPESFNLYAYKVDNTSTFTNSVLLRGYVFCGAENSTFDGNPGSLGEDIDFYLVPATYTDAGLLDTVNVYVEKEGEVIESFIGVNIQTDYADDPNQLERVLYEKSSFIRLYKDDATGEYADLTNLRGLTETELTVDGTTDRYYAGIVPTLDSSITKIHPSSVSLDPNFFNYLDMDVKEIVPYEGTYSVFRNAHGVDDIFYYDQALDEYTSAEVAVPMTVSDMRDGIVSTVSAYMIPQLTAKIYDFTLGYSFINDSVNDLAVYNAWDSVVTSRLDFMPFIDLQGDDGAVPTTNATALTYHDAIPSNYKFGFPTYPRGKVYNTFTKQSVYLGSGFAGLYACILNDLIAYPWYAPAGLNRGILPKITELEVDLSDDDLAELQGYPHRINPVVNYPGEGIVVWGQKSAQTKPSALDRINVVRALFYIIKNVKATTKYLVFEQGVNDVFLQFKRLVDPLLKDVETKSGLYKYEILMDESTTTSQELANNEVHGVIMLDFVKSAEKWVISYIVAETGSSFDLYKQ